ncbi:MAG: hypothetical protein ABW202_18305 [Duganella sp.]
MYRITYLLRDKETLKNTVWWAQHRKAAFRLNGMWAGQDDLIDFVYFKKRYLAPSLTLDLGEHRFHHALVVTTAFATACCKA